MLLSNCRLPDGRAGMHVLVRDGRVAAILDAPPEIPAGGPEVIRQLRPGLSVVPTVYTR